MSIALVAFMPYQPHCVLLHAKLGSFLCFKSVGEWVAQGPRHGRGREQEGGSRQGVREATKRGGLLATGE